MIDKPRVISLFTGIAGIDLAFVRAGFEIVAQVENDPFCQAVIKKHAPTYWPRSILKGDIRHVRGTDLPACDVLIGGFPCTDISYAGKQAGIVAGNRSGLWFEFARLIGELRPRVVFIENVPAITTNGGTTVLSSLAALRYDAEWGIVSAADAGAPHLRERWFCVAYAQGGRAISKQQSRQLRSAVESGNSLGDSASPKCQERTLAEPQSSQPIVGCPGEWLPESILVRVALRLSAGLDGHRWPAGFGQPQHGWEPPRTVAPKSLPNRANRLKALGNSVVPQVIEPFAVLIKEYLEAIQ